MTSNAKVMTQDGGYARKFRFNDEYKRDRDGKFSSTGGGKGSGENPKRELSEEFKREAASFSKKDLKEGFNETRKNNTETKGKLSDDRKQEVLSAGRYDVGKFKTMSKPELEFYISEKNRVLGRNPTMSKAFSKAHEEIKAAERYLKELG